MSGITNLVFGCMADDGGWMTVRQIADSIFDGDFDDSIKSRIHACLSRHTPSRKRPFRLEKIKSSGSVQYRLVKIKGSIASRKQVREYAHKLIPLLDQLVRETNKDRVSISFGAVCSLANQIKQILLSIDAEVPPADQASSVRPKA
jgi:hypothetical protein